MYLIHLPCNLLHLVEVLCVHSRILSCKVWLKPFYSFSAATSMSLLLLRLMTFEAIMFEIWFVQLLSFPLCHWWDSEMKPCLQKENVPSICVLHKVCLMTYLTSETSKCSLNVGVAAVSVHWCILKGRTN